MNALVLKRRPHDVRIGGRQYHRYSRRSLRSSYEESGLGIVTIQEAPATVRWHLSFSIKSFPIVPTSTPFLLSGTVRLQAVLRFDALASIAIQWARQFARRLGAFYCTAATIRLLSFFWCNCVSQGYG